MKVPLSLFLSLLSLSYGSQQDSGGAAPEDLTQMREQAERGNARAQCNLGAIYDRDQDYAEAFRWYLKAAEQDYDTAQYLLGGMYEQGKGVAQDYAEAVRWWRKAAEDGNAEAPFSLGVMYATGRGVTRNYVRAYMWATLALRAGGKSQKAAASLCDVLAAKMTPAQIAEAQRLTSAWKPETTGGRPMK
ncbi:MAG: tetratricopeptide repeat protein [Bryobacteraceae bacterium]